MDLLEWLTEWYASNCNRDWEHTYGISIRTLDNPGWSIIIDLVDTPLEGRHLAEISMNESENNWYKISSTGEQFVGYSDEKKLTLLVSKFKAFSESSII